MRIHIVLLTLTVLLTSTCVMAGTVLKTSDAGSVHSAIVEKAKNNGHY